LSAQKNSFTKISGACCFIYLGQYEKLFKVQPPVSLQNDGMYAGTGTHKKQVSAQRLLRTRPTSSKSDMLSTAVSMNVDA